MMDLLEQLIARVWNRVAVPSQSVDARGGVHLGRVVTDGRGAGTPVVIPHGKRAEHMLVLGRTGAGKSSLLRHMTAQDIQHDLGFVHIDLHGDTTPAVLRLIAAEERRRQVDLSHRVIVLEPADPEWAVGLNILDAPSEAERFVYIADVAQLLKQRWHLDTFGARTEELLRNALLALSETQLTLIELPPFLTDAAFRAQCLARVHNPEVRAFFATRYDTASDAMQAVWREAVLNKVSAFTADPHFRHMLGQVRSNVSLVDAIDQGAWILLNLDKGRLGEQAATIGALFLAKLKTALFARRARRLVTVYADELQNLIAYDSGLETVLAEARKYAVGIVAANQFLDQYPPTMRAAVMAVGTHITFQLSSGDAERFANAFDSGKSLQELLKNLPRRHMVVKTGAERWQHAVVPELNEPRIDAADLVQRSRRRWARPRAEVEREIQARAHIAGRQTREVLHDWD
jgi:energy-coupling factor transporter ATP-binding protein EcfA2